VALNNTDKGFVIIDIDLIKNDKFCEIKIQNTGHGFDKAYLKDILEPFNREGLNYIPGFTGTGMEYPLINKLAQLMKGKVTVDAKIEQGITFTLTLPASTIYPKDVEKKASEKLSEQVDKMPWEGLNVLVVEDDIMNRLLFSKILKQAAKLVIAEDGEKGLEAVGDFFKEGKTFDVVLMDINLPDQWDGIKLKNRIQELFSPYRKIPFIAQTAYAMQGDREKFLSEGFNEYISKPIIKKELVRVVIKALDSIQ
jgi:CheY-like chemotaxis protein